MSTSPMSTFDIVRQRLLPTALLSVVALGGAGLTVAGDRQHNPVQRPELTWAADATVRPLIEAMGSDLTDLQGQLSELSSSGRTALGRLQSLDLDGLAQALAEGDRLVANIGATAAHLDALLTEADVSVEAWRLGPTPIEQLELIRSAAAGTHDVAGLWLEVESGAGNVGRVVEALRAHDALVFRATTAGRQARWQEALDALDDASTALDGLKDARDVLAQRSEVGTLDDLVGRYRAYDEALRALYEYVRDGGSQSGEAFDALEGRVADLQALLPADDSVLSVIVGEAGGPAIALSLVTIDEARGKVNTALESVVAP